MGSGSRALLTLLLAAACRGEGAPAQPRSSLEHTRPAPEPSAAPPQDPPPPKGEHANIDTPELVRARERMVDEQIARRGIRDPRVLAALRAVPRHAFVAQSTREAAYEDSALPIEAGQTISQPYIVALMTELAHVAPGDKVLEVGTGSGYQAAVLAALGARVYSIEIVRALADSARERLRSLGYDVKVRHGDGYAGWPEVAPFAAILVTAAPPSVPAPLREQLAVGGRLIIPVGDAFQELRVITRTASGYEDESVAAVRFVPMTGKAQDDPPR